ncbi:MAG: OpgC domain-containing protein [Ancalomicrobiaceae bacterium]|nr:OpgC domain-containing protein [Ancalomicrobiaceae bacterium]
MARAINAIDYWRGFALVEIFINHIPGNYYEQFTHKAVSISDSAELFVFLAGWSLKFVVGPPEDPRPAPRLIAKLFHRAFMLYAAHILIVMLAIAMLAGASRLLGNSLILEWFNAAPVFYDPVDTHVGLVLLTHQLGYFDILPLYIILLLISPAIALLYRRWPSLLLPTSLAVYFAALTTETTFRTWPAEGEWFFNPLCWQLDFVLGFVLARQQGPGEWVRSNLGKIRALAYPIVVAAALLRLTDLQIDPTLMPEPHLLFVDAKSFESPIRVVQFLALVAVMSSVFPYIADWLRPIVVVFSLFGRNSLLVFCIGSLLSLGGQIARFAFTAGVALDTAYIFSGILLMFAAATLAEWWGRVR